MRVGWLVDDLGIQIGGAELTQAEFRKAAPEGVEIIDCPPGGVVSDLDRYVIHNCVTYSLEDMPDRAVKYWHDVGPHVHPDVRRYLDDQRLLCCSPLQAKHMGIDATPIPPAVPLERFRKAAESAGERRGAVAVGPWLGPAKAADAAAEWASGNGGIQFIGGGPFAPPEARPVIYDDLPEILARYKTYVHLPREIEPFGRSTVEAWAAGCEVVVNGLVGARYWITEEPEKLDTAASDFWNFVLD